MSISGTTSAYPNQGLITMGTGPASGINYSQILAALQQYLSQPITVLQTQEGVYNNQLSAWQTIGTDLTNLNNAAQALASPSLMQNYTATSSNTGVATATASSSALPGTYSFTVNQLAQANEIGSQGVASTSTAVAGSGTGTFNITVNGTTTNVTLNSTTGYTLADLAQAINNANAGVSAAIINDGSANDPYRLVLTSNNTGTNGAISITNNLSGGSVNLNFNSTTINPTYWVNQAVSTDALPADTGTYTGTQTQTYTFTAQGSGTVGTNAITYDWTNSSGQSGSFTVPSTETGTTSYYIDGSTSSNSTNSGIELTFTAGQTVSSGDKFSLDAFNPQMVAAQNAVINYGNDYITSQSNTVTNAIPGVTLSLAGTGSASVTVALNSSAINSDVSSFISSYNQLISDINSQLQYNTQTKSSGPLGGSATLMTLKSSLMSFMGSVAPGLTGNNGLASTYGITADPSGSGKLQFNSTTLDSMLTSNPTQAQQYFSSLFDGSPTANGVAQAGGMITYLNSYTNSANGIIQYKEAGINSNITNLNNQISLEQSMVQQQMGVYTQEFSQLESYIGQMNTTNQALTSSIAQLP
ncbi:MAG: flagellar filament capping protein FliD [Deltaproteobacteria bacterium]|nr:flagellar filament capping protein FliD [Deltaproteobacteria bacterium]MCL5892375.1 flagellar filament capping protein FliD [Deltaproteobacteria bacterium]